MRRSRHPSEGKSSPEARPTCAASREASIAQLTLVWERLSTFAGEIGIPEDRLGVNVEYVRTVLFWTVPDPDADRPIPVGVDLVLPDRHRTAGDGSEESRTLVGTRGPQ